MIELSVDEIESIYYDNATAKGVRLSLAAWWELHGYHNTFPHFVYDADDLAIKYFHAHFVKDL